MTSVLCRKSPARDALAVALCFSSASIMSLEALHGNSCLWLGLNADQTYALSAGIATASVFLGSFILAGRGTMNTTEG